MGDTNEPVLRLFWVNEKEGISPPFQWIFSFSATLCARLRISGSRRLIDRLDIPISSATSICGSLSIRYSRMISASSWQKLPCRMIVPHSSRSNPFRLSGSFIRAFGISRSCSERGGFLILKYPCPIQNDKHSHHIPGQVKVSISVPQQDALVHQLLDGCFCPFRDVFKLCIHCQSS